MDASGLLSGEGDRGGEESRFLEGSPGGVRGDKDPARFSPLEGGVKSRLVSSSSCELDRCSTATPPPSSRLGFSETDSREGEIDSLQRLHVVSLSSAKSSGGSSPDFPG